MAKKATNIGERADTMRELIILAASAQKNIDIALHTISNNLLVVARSYQEKGTVKNTPDGERFAANSEGFILACKLEEDYIRSPEAGDSRCEKLPRCWTQAKSNIKASLELGIDIGKYTSESALRKEVVRVRGLNGNTPVTAALASLKKDINILADEEALDILRQASAAIASIKARKAKEAGHAVTTRRDNAEANAKTKTSTTRKTTATKTRRNPAAKTSNKPIERVAPVQEEHDHELSDIEVQELLAEELELQLATA